MRDSPAPLTLAAALAPILTMIALFAGGLLFVEMRAELIVAVIYRLCRAKLTGGGTYDSLLPHTITAMLGEHTFLCVALEKQELPLIAALGAP
jgi:hypothetical protein